MSQERMIADDSAGVKGAHQGIILPKAGDGSDWS
jgi:hypothetical protein